VGGRGPRAGKIHPILGFWGKKFTKKCNSLSWTPMNCSAKCDAASFILGGEIRNRTNTKQTVNDISTPCLETISITELLQKWQHGQLHP